MNLAHTPKDGFINNGLSASDLAYLASLKSPTKVYRHKIARGVYEIWEAFPFKDGCHVMQYLESQPVTGEGPPLRRYF